MRELLAHALSRSGVRLYHNGRLLAAEEVQAMLDARHPDMEQFLVRTAVTALRVLGLKADAEQCAAVVARYGDET